MSWLVETFLFRYLFDGGSTTTTTTEEGLGSMRANWPWRMRLGVLAGRQTSWDEEQAPTTPETDTGDAARALTTHTSCCRCETTNATDEKKTIRILRSRAAAWRLTGLSLFFTVLGVRSVVAAGRPRTYTFGANHGRATGTGRGRDRDKFSHLYHGLGWVGGEVREGVIGRRQGEVR